MRKFEKILVLGAGPVKIGQSLEFDYSALQVCKALKEEGVTVIFANSTPSAFFMETASARKDKELLPEIAGNEHSAMG